MTNILTKDQYCDFENVLKNYLNTAVNSHSFEVKGVIDNDLKIHTLGSDSKIIGRLFEMCVQPILQELANDFGLILGTPKKQNDYPDFYFYKDNTNERIAIDVKSTYIDKKTEKFNFTLGSYASYIRNNTKNICSRYTDYVKHYVIGFVYKRNSQAQQSNVFSLDDISKVECPFILLHHFLQEKYKIVGTSTGSGNTENMSSIISNDINDFILGKGEFSDEGIFGIYGKNVYELYWCNFPRYKDKNKKYTNLNSFIGYIHFAVENYKSEIIEPPTWKEFNNEVKAKIYFSIEKNYNKLNNLCDIPFEEYKGVLFK